MQNKEQEFSFKSLFIPFTTIKAIHWIVIIGLVVFANMLFNGFLWDDEMQLVGNSFVHQGQYFYYFTHTIGPYYKPFMFVIYTFLFNLFNLNPFYYHLLQLLIHIANTILIFLLFLRFSKNVSFSFLLSLIFLIHPINEETVVYVANYQDVLFTFFGLLALLVSYSKIITFYKNLLILLLLLFSMLSKETGILFSIILIINRLFFYKRSMKFLIYPVSAIFMYLLIRFSLVGFIQPTKFTTVPVDTIASASLFERIITIPKIIFFYFTTLIYPNDLGVQSWYVSTISLFNFLLPLIFDALIFVGLLWVGFYLWKKRSSDYTLSYWFFFIWFVLGLGIHLQLIPLDVTAADRWFYFPMIGLLGMLLSFVSSLGRTFVKNYLFYIVVFIILTLLGIRTIIRNTNWHDSLTFFSHEITTRINVSDIEYNYGTALFDAGDYAKASTHLQIAADISPNSYEVWHNLGISYLQIGQINKASKSLNQSIKLNPDDEVAYRGMIYIEIIKNQFVKAQQMSEDRIKKWPQDYFLWRLYGLSVYYQKNYKLAAYALNKSYAISPTDETTQYYLLQEKKHLPIALKEL